MHLRGNAEGFVRAASTEKWLELHGGEHWTSFYTAAASSLQRGSSTGSSRATRTAWPDEPRVRLRRPARGRDVLAARRGGVAAPGTRWTRLYLAAAASSAEPAGAEDARVRRARRGDRASRAAVPRGDGAHRARLPRSSSSRRRRADADLFLIVLVYDPDGEEVVFQGSNDPRSALGKGWLRASHRKPRPGALDRVPALPLARRASSRSCPARSTSWTSRSGR